MSRSRSDDLDLDALVDDVAREMTGGLPAAGFKARVTARIEGEGAAPIRSRRLGWMLAPAAAAAAMVLAVVVVREVQPPTRQAHASSTESQPRPQEPNVVSGATTAEAQRQDGAGIIRRADTGNASASTRPAVPPPPASDVVPLTLAPLEVDRLDVAPIARGEAIEISPMAIERIEIAAMP